MSNKTETKVSKREKDIAELTETMWKKNDANKMAMFAFLEKEAVTLALKITKRQRISNTFTGKFVVEMANKAVKAIFDETGKDTPAIAILSDLRSAEKCAEHMTIGRFNAYARILGNRFDCLLSDNDVIKAINVTASAIFKAIPQS